MSRAQGDAYKTWTDHKLNAYKARMDAKLRKLIDHKEKWYRAGAGWILCQERNRMTNPNGSWKWNGWEIEAHEYWITVFPEECVEIKNGEPTAIGWSQVVKVIDDDKEAANEFFTKAKFRAELEDYVELESTLFYYLFTELFLMVDSRAKNAFPSFMGTSLVEE